MLQPWRQGQIIKIHSHTDATRSYLIKVSDTDNFTFTPGQFVTIELPIHEKPHRRLRSYSVASWPDGSNVFELVITLLEGGAGTTWLFENAVEGMEITFRGPLGIFTLQPEYLQKELFLICTGTGVAPFRSMLHSLVQNNNPFKNIHLIFGTRTFNDALYYTELEELAAATPGLNYYLSLSREEWKGRKGYVHEIYENLCKDHPEARFMLCGWKNMLDEARQRIQAMGYDKKDIVLESYG